MRDSRAVTPSSVRCTIDSNDSFVLSGLDRKSLAVVRKLCSYKIAGAHYVKSAWDGTVYLYKKALDGSVRVKIGLLAPILNAFPAIQVDDRRANPPRINVVLNPALSPRPHQVRSIDAVTAPGPLYGQGTIKAAIRSGKTITSAFLIAKMRVSTLFVVPSQHLAIQSREVLSSALCTQVGLIGLGEYEIRDITVATTQSLSALDAKQRKSLVGRFSLVIVDEVHHMTGKEWNKGICALHPRYRVGLSATAYFEADSEIGRGILNALALCGPVRVDVSVREMIDAGFLVDPLIYMHRISTPQFKGRYGAELIEACITTNAERNTKIAKIAQEAFAGGKSVLIIARLLDHIEALRAAVEALGLPVATCIGETSAQERKSAVESLLRREKIVISNVLGEGVDLPALEVVIVAAGGKDPKETMQRLRCLTACVGKNQAIVHDFHDTCSTYLMQHSEIRLATYAREFRVTKTYKERPESCSKRHYNMFPS